MYKYISDNKGSVTKMNEVQDIYALQHSYLVLVEFLEMFSIYPGKKCK